MEVSRTVADILLSIGAVKVSLNPPFTWVSGIKSPVYCDNRRLISHVIERQLVVDAFKEVMQQQEMVPDVIAGTATAAIPWAAFVAYEMQLPMIYIRPEKKEHGQGKQIEGDIEPGKRVLIIEDLISTGGSSLKAAEAVKQETQAKVSDVLAIVTWDLAKSVKAFEKAKLNLTTLTNFSSLINLAVDKALITPQEKLKILEFQAEPDAWAKKVGLVK